MVLGAENITYMCIAVLKKGSRITGLRLLHIPSFRDAGTYELEYLYQTKTPIFNVYIQECKRRDNTTYLRAVGLHGDINRYPVMDDKGEAVFARALTIVATMQTMEKKTFKTWLSGGKFIEEVKEVPVTYYIMSNYEGCVGKMSAEQAMQLAIKYHVSNAMIAGKHLRPLSLKGVTNPEFVEICEEDKYCVDQAHFISRMTNMDSANASNMEELLQFIVKSKMVPLTPEQSRRCRVLGDTVHSKKFRRGAFGLTEKEIKDINRYTDRVLMWDYLQENCLEFMMRMYDKVCVDDKKMAELFGLDTDPTFKSIGMRAVFSTLKNPVDRLYNMQSYSNLHGEAKSTYCAILKQEPQVTGIMKSLAESMGCKLEGLDYRIKSPSSYTEKIYEREKLAGHSLKEACDSITDVLRYTVVFECNETDDHYVEKTDALIRYLRSVIEHLLLYFRNYWCIEKNPYNGINTAFQLPETVIKYELQVHTPESFEVKNGAMHKLYEESRAVSTTEERRVELAKEMNNLSSKMRYPAGVLQFDVSLWKDYSKKETKGY